MRKYQYSLKFCLTYLNRLTTVEYNTCRCLSFPILTKFTIGVIQFYFIRLYKYAPNLESLLTQQYVCVMCTLWPDNTCVFTRFHSVKNANTHLSGALERDPPLRVIGLDMTENRIFTLCRMITWVVFLRMFWNFISSLPGYKNRILCRDHYL
jgi:hypothetical protein